MLLDPSENDVYVDIASEGSPVPEIYSNLFGTKVYRQDLAYPDGINENLIGGDAANMPVPDGFATKMALHCSLEHFEGTSDIGFIKEVSRVLSPGGSVCIVPLYLAKNYSIQTDPAVSVPSQVPFEEDAVLHCAFGWGNRHGRFYDPSHFISRIYQNLNGMTLSIYRIRNAQQVDPSCYVQFAALIQKPL
jgi:SAM-dependent methyltransferase